jgi:hypothetical protein
MKPVMKALLLLYFVEQFANLTEENEEEVYVKLK